MGKRNNANTGGKSKVSLEGGKKKKKKRMAEIRKK